MTSIELMKILYNLRDAGLCTKAPAKIFRFNLRGKN